MDLIDLRPQDSGGHSFLFQNSFMRFQRVIVKQGAALPEIFPRPDGYSLPIGEAIPENQHKAGRLERSVTYEDAGGAASKGIPEPRIPASSGLAVC